MKRKWGRTAVILALAPVLAACGAQPEQTPTPVMSFAEVSAELDALLLSVQDLLPGEWRIADSGPRTCTLASGEKGADSGYARLMSPGVPLDEQRALTDAVMKVWTDAGYPVTTRVRDPINDLVAVEVVYPESGVTPDGFQLEFAMTTKGIYVSGQTRCGVGDTREMSQQ